MFDCAHVFIADLSMISHLNAKLIKFQVPVRTSFGLRRHGGKTYSVPT